MVLGALVAVLMGTLTPAHRATAGETFPRTRIVPVDEGVRDPSFAAFRARLDRAIQAHDAAFVRSILDPKVITSFGGDGGPEEFVERWKPDDLSSALWTLLTQLLGMGSTLRREDGAVSVSYPYLYEGVGDVLDTFEAGVVTGSGVNVRERPDRDAPVVARLDHELVRVTDWGSGERTGASADWVPVELCDGRSGFVSRSLIRSPGGDRIGFARKGEAWVMTFLVAGD